MKANVYSIITDKFIEALERGEVAWQQPWKTANGSNFVSHTSGKAYSFLNCMLMMMQGGSCGEYLTAQQVFKEKGKFKRDAKHLATLLEERKTLITIINIIHKQTNI